jgi:type I restriction enzyme R subunit
LALASVSFHENTPPEQLDRYRRDLKYFMQLRSSVARRYAEKVDFKQYQASIQKLLDTYVGAGEVETLVDPVSILDKEAFAKDVDEAGNAEAKAEMIANRVRRSIHEHFDEDPVFYRKFSELIDKALQDARSQRITQLDCLKQMQELCERVRDKRGYEDVPAILKTREVARSYYDVVRDQLAQTEVIIPDSVAAELAVSVEDIILTHRKVDWAEDTDVQNRMKIDIEDRIFALKTQHRLALSFDTIDRILDRVIDIARRRVP